VPFLRIDSDGVKFFEDGCCFVVVKKTTMKVQIKMACGKNNNFPIK
jgi:hypothetical protein